MYHHLFDTVALIQKHKIKVCLECMKVLQIETSETNEKSFRTNGINNKCMKSHGTFFICFKLFSRVDSISTLS